MIKNDMLLQQVGCDAYLYIRFVSLLRKLLLIMSFIGLCILIPINIAATRATGDWPQENGSIDILSIAGINIQNGKSRVDPYLDWYWSPFAATWLFSLLIAYAMHDATGDYIKARKHFFCTSESQVSMRTLIVRDVPVSVTSKMELKEWIKSKSNIDNIKDSMIGFDNLTLCKLIEKHETAAKQLQICERSCGDGRSINISMIAS
jgi:hypothetical protein